MARFILMLRDTGWNPEEMSAEEIQKVLEKYAAWRDRIRGEGQKLRDDEGRVLRRGPSGVSVTDGPYAEAKEVIGGYMVVEAADYDAAIRLCDDSPHFDFGSIEIRRFEDGGD